MLEKVLKAMLLPQVTDPFKFWQVCNLNFSSVKPSSERAFLNSASLSNLPITLFKPANVEITIYNHAGELVNEFNLGRLSSGEHLVNFNLIAENGIYYVVVNENGIKQVARKLTILK